MSLDRFEAIRAIILLLMIGSLYFLPWIELYDTTWGVSAKVYSTHVAVDLGIMQKDLPLAAFAEEKDYSAYKSLTRTTNLAMLLIIIIGISILFGGAKVLAMVGALVFAYSVYYWFALCDAVNSAGGRCNPLDLLGGTKASGVIVKMGFGWYLALILGIVAIVYGIVNIGKKEVEELE